jgi:hypothetical protein
MTPQSIDDLLKSLGKNPNDLPESLDALTAPSAADYFHMPADARLDRAGELKKAADLARAINKPKSARRKFAAQIEQRLDLNAAAKMAKQINQK